MESGMEWLQAVSVLQLEKKDKESDGGFVEVEEGLKKQTSVWYIAGKLLLTLYLYLIS